MLTQSTIESAKLKVVCFLKNNTPYYTYFLGKVESINTFLVFYNENSEEVG